jgi:3-dehydroquinate dehydratase-1
MAQLATAQNPLQATRPLTVGVLADAAAVEAWRALDAAQRAQTCDVLELRLDSLPLDASALRQLVAETAQAQAVLITARHPAEGGQGQLDSAARRQRLESLLSVAQLMDIELQSLGEMKPLIQQAQAAGLGVIGSLHDFQSTPSLEVLEGALRFAQSAGLNAFKVATHLNHPRDLQRLIDLTLLDHPLRRCVMGMGTLGKISRLTLARLGSLLNYGFIGQANAPGQWPAAQLRQLLGEL